MQKPKMLHFRHRKYSFPLLPLPSSLIHLSPPQHTKKMCLIGSTSFEGISAMRKRVRY